MHRASNALRLVRKVSAAASSAGSDPFASLCLTAGGAAANRLLGLLFLSLSSMRAVQNRNQREEDLTAEAD